MTVYVEVDTSDVERELARLAAGPSRADRLELYKVLFGQFQLTQLRVHVITESLRRSGHVETTADDHIEWAGEFSYGGQSTGSEFDPVLYAQYEQARDGFHDFMQDVYGGSQGYADAILDFYRGTHA